MIRFALLSSLLGLAFLAGTVTAQEQAQFSSRYVRPFSYGGLFYVRRGDGVVMDAQAAFDPRALVLSYNDKPIDQKPNDPDAPTYPGFYLSYSARFDFERVEVIGKKVTFRTRTIAGVRYRFSGSMGMERVAGMDASVRAPFIKGVLRRFKDGKLVSEESIKFVHAVVA